MFPLPFLVICVELASFLLHAWVLCILKIYYLCRYLTERRLNGENGQGKVGEVMWSAKRTLDSVLGNAVAGTVVTGNGGVGTLNATGIVATGVDGSPVGTPTKRPRGRPKGSKNKTPRTSTTGVGAGTGTITGPSTSGATGAPSASIGGVASHPTNVPGVAGVGATTTGTGATG